jgi:hypothetical protein
MTATSRGYESRDTSSGGGVALGVDDGEVELPDVGAPSMVWWRREVEVGKHGVGGMERCVRETRDVKKEKDMSQ